MSRSHEQEPDRARCEACGQGRGPSELYRAVLNRRAVEVARLPKGSRGRGTAGTTGRSADPMPFPRIPSGDIICGAPFVNSIRDHTTGGAAKFDSSTRSY